MKIHCDVVPSPQHHSPSSSSSSDSYDSDYDRPERPKSRKSQGSNRESDCLPAQVTSAPQACWHFIFIWTLLCDISSLFQHGRDSKGSHGNSQKSPPHKSSDFDKYSDYSEEYDEEEGDYDDGMSEYQQSKDSPSQGRGRYPKDQMRRGGMRGMKQQCMEAFSFVIAHIVIHLTDDHLLHTVIFSWAEGERQRERTRQRTWDAQQEQEAEGKTLGWTWARSRMRSGNGRNGKYAPEN